MDFSFETEKNWNEKFFFRFFKKLLKRDKNHQIGSDVLLQRDLDWVDIKRIFLCMKWKRVWLAVWNNGDKKSMCMGDSFEVFKSVVLIWAISSSLHCTFKLYDYFSGLLLGFECFSFTSWNAFKKRETKTVTRNKKFQKTRIYL